LTCAMKCFPSILVCTI